MKLHFDPNQSFQLDAVRAVVDLFDGQPKGGSLFSTIEFASADDLFAGQGRGELGIGNQLLLDEERLLANTRVVQLRNDIDMPNESAPLQSWELFDAPAGLKRWCPHFSVEMETGTGKTYVYLRTIFELSAQYGFRKFIIVVPSVAIREGVLHTIETTAEHFSALYDTSTFKPLLYDAKRVSALRQFATGNTLQVLVINIDAFNKNFAESEDERKGNVIYKESDKLSGRQPIEFVQAARPIVIIDEPQSVDTTERAQEAIKALNPLCTLRYSATHKHPYNLVYRLDPVRAFELRLVKKIVVASAVAEHGANDAFVRVEDIVYKPKIKAKLRVHVQGPGGPKEKSVTVERGHDLFRRSNECAHYAQGFEIVEIDGTPGSEFLRFSNGRVLRKGEEIGGLRPDVWRVQVRQTIRRHLEKELQVRSRGVKVLSLFFIDRVSNYRSYDANGKPMKGELAAVFEEELVAMASNERYRELFWLQELPEKLHNGYFSSDKKGVLKDTRGDTQADDDAYALIMKDKERLLSLDEPLRFIFSHSALREGWDNPNVFQICTLNEVRSTFRKRQEIGRGLRLPVDREGKRVFDDSINVLFVMANESYEEFARTLQAEYEEDCGVTFGKIPLTAIAKLTQVINGEEQPIGKPSAERIRTSLIEQGILEADGRISATFTPNLPGFTLTLPEPFAALQAEVIDLLSNYRIERHIRKESDQLPNRFRKEVQITPEFQELWERIKPKTAYRVEFSTDELVANAVRELKRMESIEPPKIRVTSGLIDVAKGGVSPLILSVGEERATRPVEMLPDILSYLQNETELTRATLVRILRESGRLSEFFVNPQRFMDKVAAILKHELRALLVDGIKYERIEGDGAHAAWDMLLFKDEELVEYLTSLRVEKSIYEYISYDSEIEREFARRLDVRQDIKLFVKLPSWFKIDTPVGTYNPDWAIVKENDQTLYLVRETKGTKDFLKLRNSERDKVFCGKRHFEALNVSFEVVMSADEI